MSLIPPKAAVNADIFVRPVRPNSRREQMQHGMLFDHLVGAGKSVGGTFEAERLRHDQVNDEVELGRLLTGRSAGFAPRKILSIKSPGRR
jgi:hypothetical protein